MKCCQTAAWGLVSVSALALAIPSARRALFARFGVRSSRPALSDALTDAMHDARARVNAEAGNYRLPAVPGTRSQAIMAYILLMRSAAGEDARNAGWYRGRANEAAYKFRNADARNILKTAADLTRSGAPRTSSVAADILGRLPSMTPAAAPARRAVHAPRRRRGGAHVDVDTSVSPDAAALEAPPPSGEGMPTWLPWAGAAGLALALLAGAAALARSRG